MESISTHGAAHPLCTLLVYAWVPINGLINGFPWDYFTLSLWGSRYFTPFFSLVTFSIVLYLTRWLVCPVARIRISAYSNWTALFLLWISLPHSTSFAQILDMTGKISSRGQSCGKKPILNFLHGKIFQATNEATRCVKGNMSGGGGSKDSERYSSFCQLYDEKSGIIWFHEQLQWWSPLFCHVPVPNSCADFKAWSWYLGNCLGGTFQVMPCKTPLHESCQDVLWLKPTIPSFLWSWERQFHHITLRYLHTIIHALIVYIYIIILYHLSKSQYLYVYI